MSLGAKDIVGYPAAHSDCPPHPVAAAPMGSRNVIVVDDEITVRKFVSAAVKKLGLNAIEASSAEEVKALAGAAQVRHSPVGPVPRA